jgi:hypothetical protein
MISRSRHPRPRFRPGLEILEGRQLPNNLLSSLSFTPPPNMFKRTVV